MSGIIPPPVTPAVLTLPPPGQPPTAPALVIDGHIRVPPGITDLESFRQWTRSEQAPQHVRLAWLAGTLWIDATREQLYTHNQVKAEVTRVLGNLVRAADLGLFVTDGMNLSNPAARLSTVP